MDSRNSTLTPSTSGDDYDITKLLHRWQESQFASDSSHNSNDGITSQRFRTYSSDSQSSGYSSASSPETVSQPQVKVITEIAKQPDFVKLCESFFEAKIMPKLHHAIEKSTHPISSILKEVVPLLENDILGYSQNCTQVMPSVKLEPVSQADIDLTKAQNSQNQWTYVNTPNIPELPRPVKGRNGITCNNASPTTSGKEFKSMSHPDLSTQGHWTYATNPNTLEPPKPVRGRPKLNRYIVRPITSGMKFEPMSYPDPRLSTPNSPGHWTYAKNPNIPESPNPVKVGLFVEKR